MYVRQNSNIEILKLFNNIMIFVGQWVRGISTKGMANDSSTYKELVINAGMPPK
jgi:hypothetical protein